MMVRDTDIFQLLLVLSLFSCFIIVNGTFLETSRELQAARIVEQRKLMKSLGLGLPQRTDPNRRGFLVKKYSAPKFMLNLFNEVKNEHPQDTILHINSSKENYITERKYLEETQVDTVISFFKYEHDDIKGDSQKSIKIKFNTKINYNTEQVQGGEFKVYKRKPRISTMSHILCNVTVYKINKGKERVFLDTRAFRAWNTGWLSFNVTRAIKEWIRYPHTNHGLRIVVGGPRGEIVNPHEFGIVSARGNKEKRPYLVSFVNSVRDFSSFSQNIQISRDRRSTRNIGQRSPRKACHLKKFYVNFKKIGLHKTIIAPVGYHAYLCKGSCVYPMARNANATNHALLQSMAHLVLDDVPDPCCSPLELKPLSILYFDNENNIVLTLHPDMIVTSCACQ